MNVTREIIEADGRYTEEQRQAYREELFQAHWKILTYRTQYLLKNFAKYPTESNEAYAIGYLAALYDHKVLGTGAYEYLLTLVSRLRKWAWIAEAVKEAP